MRWHRVAFFARIDAESIQDDENDWSLCSKIVPFVNLLNYARRKHASERTTAANR